VLVSAKGATKNKPKGFLRLVPMSKMTVAAFVASVPGVDLDKRPRIELPVVEIKDSTDGPFVALDLTPDGIEFRGSLVNPLRAFGQADGPDRVNLVLRLVRIADPLSPADNVWTLELVREEDDNAKDDKIGSRVRQALSIVRSAFGPAKGKTLLLDVNTLARDLAVRWPLEMKNKSVGLPGKDPQDWRLWVDRGAIRASLIGVPVRGGELPTAVDVLPNRLELSNSKTGAQITLDVDRRDPSQAGGNPDKIPGPRVTLSSDAALTKIVIADPGKNLTWFIDPRVLARRLVERYAKAGVQPDQATTTYAFLPVTGGWLQLPIGLEETSADPEEDKAAATVSQSVEFTGSVEYVLNDAGVADAPQGRRMAISAADYVRVTADFKKTEVTNVITELSGSAGSVDGLLWMAAGSPSAENILPSFDAGPAALIGPELAFRRPTAATAGLMPLTSDTFAPGQKFKLALPRSASSKRVETTAYLWQGYVDVPLVTAIGMTRTAESSGQPSATRGLLCRQLARTENEIVLECGETHSIPDIKLRRAEAIVDPVTLPLAGAVPETANPPKPGKKSPFESVPLAAVTLPGIELRPETKPFKKLPAKLRFDLPILDELFANTRLPEKAPATSPGTGVPKPPPADAPTSLDFPRLLEAWQKAVDRLELSRVQAADVFAFGPHIRTKVPVSGLVEGATWSPDFKLKASGNVEGQTYAIGSYELGGETFSGRTALQGLSKTFNKTTLRDMVKDVDDALRVVGFSAPLRKQKVDYADLLRDTRAAFSAAMPKAETFGTAPQGLVFREAGYIDWTTKKPEIIRFWRATLANPIKVEPPTANRDETRDLGLWFRDLPLAGDDKQRKLVNNPDGPELSIGPRQSAFNREQLPSSIYEWRFCNDAAKPAPPQPSSAYEIAIGPFHFRPLRLLDLRLIYEDAWHIGDAKVLGTLTLRNTGPSTNGKGPFESESAYATGNLVAISLPVDVDSKLTFAKAVWEDVQVSANEPAAGEPAVTAKGAPVLLFRMSGVRVNLGDTETSAQERTTVVLELTAKASADEKGIPEFESAKLDTVVFGCRLHLEKGTVEVKNGKNITATFDVPTTKTTFSGILLDSARVEINPDATGANPELFLKGYLRIVAGDPPSNNAKPPPVGRRVIEQRLGESLWWLNQTIAREHLTIAVDHQRGVMTIWVDWRNIPETLQPIVGLLSEKPSIRARLTLAIKPMKPGEKKSSFDFPSVSGFGEFILASPGPTRRIDHVIVGNDPVWSSRIEVDLSIHEHTNRIHWPIDSLDKKKEIQWDNLGARVTGAAMQGTIKAFNSGNPLRHTVSMNVFGQSIMTQALDVTENPRRVAFGKPWTFHAVVEHTIESTKKIGKKLTWTTLDHVSVVDAHALVAAATSAIKLPHPAQGAIFAFAARYKVIDPQDHESIAVKAGLILRAFAQAGFPVEALASELAQVKPDKIGEGLVITAAGPTIIATRVDTEGPFWPDRTGPRFITADSQGVPLALPWLTAVDKKYGLDDDHVLAGYDQAPISGEATWDAPDIDWAAGSPVPMSRSPVPTQAIGFGSAAEIAAMLARAMPGVPGDEPIRALAAVEQTFLRHKGKVDIKQRPIWLRSLVALRTVWNALSAAGGAIDDRVVLVVPSGRPDGSVVRIKLAPRRNDKDAYDSEAPIMLTRGGDLVAIDCITTKSEPLPAGDLITDASGGAATEPALRRARLVARADRLVANVAALIAVAEKAKPEDTSAALWVNIDVPPDLDDAVLDIPIEVKVEDRLYASPALGWPTKCGMAAAATGALGMGSDVPFQDVGPDADPKSDDVKEYGSGLSGHAASLSLPARADTDVTTPQDGPFVDVRSPVFVALGRKMIFERPLSHGLPIVSPPARYLSAGEARVVVPVAEELKTTLARVVKGQAAPIVPPHLERTIFGLRPGAMQAEFEMLLFTEGVDSAAAENMVDDAPWFGRPGHAGPRLMRQLRPPRGPALPRVPVDLATTHGRRTFVALDDKDGRFPKPFRLFAGIATVLRRINGKGSEESYQIRVLGMPLEPEWNGELTLQITSPSYATDKEQELAEALAQLGLLTVPPKGMGMSASLSIDRFPVPFAKATWAKKPGTGAIELTLRGADTTGLRARLDQVNGDSEVILQIRCAKEADNTANSFAPNDFPLGNPPGKAYALEPETRRKFALRLPVRPTSRPSLKIDPATLVFADPSYDRELSGPGSSDPQRDNDGRMWKLALDRFEYGPDTPLYFAFGEIDPSTGLFASPGLKPKDVVLTLQRQPASKEGRRLPAEPLTIAGVSKVGTNGYEIEVRSAYGITFDRLLNEDHPVSFLDGDQIVVSVSFKDPANPDVKRSLSVRATVVPRPIIAPPPAVYSLVAFTGTASKPETARAALHAAAPLPQRIEFIELLEDLAIGHVRRRALFIWTMSTPPAMSPRSATLVKIDRAGGAQLPEQKSDIQEPCM